MVKLPSDVDIEILINDLRTFSWEVCETLLNYSRMIKDPNNKSNIIKSENMQDPVTLADLKVNEIIIQRINAKYKGVNWQILSEENVKIASFSNCHRDADWVWVLDPLDGTKDFIQGSQNYAMHLSLNYKQKPYIGIVLIPEKNELWIANGEKSWCERRNKSLINPHLLDNKLLKDMTIVTSKNHRNKILGDLIDRVGFKKVIIMGSIGCKIASILRGESDIYICLSLPGKNSPKDWDFSAPEAILKTAGGAITNLYNEPLSYGKFNFEQGGIIVASSNQANHESICLEIKEIIKKNDLYPL